MADSWRLLSPVHRLACLALGAGTPLLAAAAAAAGAFLPVAAIVASVLAVGCAFLLVAVLAEPPDAPGDGGLGVGPPPPNPRDPGGDDGLVDWERFERELAAYARDHTPVA